MEQISFLFEEEGAKPYASIMGHCPRHALGQMLEQKFESMLQYAADVLDLAAIAEEEIEAAKARWPNRAAALDAAFRDLFPPEKMIGMDDRVYRSHVRELLGWIAEGRPLDEEATAAECLVEVLHATLRSPMTWTALLVAEHFFREVFGGEAEALYGQSFTHVPHPEETRRMVEDIRRRLARRRETPDPAEAAA